MCKWLLISVDGFNTKHFMKRYEDININIIIIIIIIKNNNDKGNALSFTYTFDIGNT